MDNLNWIAVEWGSSSLKVWAMDANDSVLDNRAYGQVLYDLSQDDFEPTLLRIIGDWLPVGRQIRILCCGMVGGHQGWKFAPFLPVPSVPIADGGWIDVPTNDQRLTLRILGGLSQENPADVMRGEETQIAGFLSENKSFDGVLCMPGAQTKWVQISAGEIVSFRTYMSGEVFSLFSGQSVLRHSIIGDGWDDDVFLSAVKDAISAPQNILSNMYNIRAKDLLGKATKQQRRPSLSGYLIGSELAGARHYWLGQNLVVLADALQAHPYKIALKAQGVIPKVIDPKTMVLQGLRIAYSQWE